MHFTIMAGGGSVADSDAVTDSAGLATVGSWTLGATKGTNVLAASVGDSLAVSFTATAGAYSPDVTPSISQPHADAIVGDTLQVAVSVTSRSELASVAAAVGTTRVALSYSTPDKDWEGTVPLQGLPRDTLQLEVTATDVNGAATDAFVRFVHDRKPTLTVTAPDSGAIARPSIDFSADCTDDDPAGCSSLAVAVSYDKIDDDPALATGQSHISGTASLADFDGQTVYLIFTARDSRGQLAEAFRQVYVEASTKLSEIATVDGSVMDFRGDHVLYRGVDGMITLRDVTSGATQPIYPDTALGAAPPYGYVTSTGAIFAVGKSTHQGTEGFEWRNGTLVDLGTLNGSSSLEVSGNYAIFSDDETLTRRDLVAGTNTTISTDAGNTHNGVASNGDVAFWSSDYRVYRYRGGTTTLLTPDDGTGRGNTYPVTDGVNVVYRKSTPCCTAQTYAIVLHNDAGDTVLAPARMEEPVPEGPPNPQPTDYAVNSGWTAFTALGTGGVLQVWTRSPTGELRQVSSSGTDSRVSALASDGTVIFEDGTGRYVVPPGGTLEKIMSRLGTVVWREGRFLAFIGNTVYAITP